MTKVKTTVDIEWERYDKKPISKPHARLLQKKAFEDVASNIGNGFIGNDNLYACFPARYNSPNNISYKGKWHVKDPFK